MPAAKKLILHIEDDKTLQLLVKATLEKAGYQVYCALDAMQGLMMVRQMKPDLVVLDIMMPAGGGGSVFQRIRALNTTFTTPVVVYSAAEPAEIAKLVTADSLTEIIPKGGPPGALLEAVQRLLPA